MAVAQAPNGRDGDPEKKGRPGRGGPGGPPPRFELGRLLPPHAIDELDLTPEQAKQLADLEKDVKARLQKILTAEQRKKLENLPPPPRPGGPPPQDPGRPRDKGERPGGPGPGEPPPPPREDEALGAPVSGGIQWFATLESGLREAQRTGRPILFVSAAPHCGGVSGTW
jgi:hypothetical protein